MVHDSPATPAARPAKPFSKVGAALLLILPLAVFWRRDFFFLFDDWTELATIVNSHFFSYIFAPNGEIWFPLFRTLFYGLVHLVGANYGVYIAINGVLLGCDAIALALLLRRGIHPGVSYFLAVVFVMSSANAVIVWNAFYLCYLLCLFFFLLAWLRTDTFLDTSGRKGLVAIGACCLASVLCHPATLLALVLLPLYAWLAAPGAIRSKVVPLALTAGAVLALYTLMYFLINSLMIVSVISPNRPDAFILGNYLLHCFYGAFLSPFTQLNFSPNQDKIRSFAWVVAGVVTGLVLATTCFGTPKERALGLGGLLFNILIFALISLGRHQLSLIQALSPRYGFFAVIGLLLLYGVFWNSMLRADFDLILSVLTPLCLVGYLFFLTETASAVMDGQYTHWGRASRLSYQGFAALADQFTKQEAAAALLYPQLRVFTQGQVDGLRRLLGE